MDKMPGFTAEASLYKTSNSYSMAATFEAIQKGRTVYPQRDRPTGPSGPFGLPGTRCYGACFHVCAMRGGGSPTTTNPFFMECIENCMKTCTDSYFTARL